MEAEKNKSAATKRVFTELHKLRISESLVESWKKRRLRFPAKPKKERVSRKGIPLDPEVKAKISKHYTNMWKDPAYREKMLARQKAAGLRNYPVKE